MLVPELRFPAASGFDVQNPAATAAGLGLTTDRLETMLKTLIASGAQRWGEMPGHVIAGLCGLHGVLADLPVDWPMLSDPAGPGTLLSDPVAALQEQARRVSLGVSADGTPFFLPAVRWLAALLGNRLPLQPTADVDGFEELVEGSGRYEDPWAFSVG